MIAYLTTVWRFGKIVRNAVCMAVLLTSLVPTAHAAAAGGVPATRPVPHGVILIELPLEPVPAGIPILVTLRVTNAGTGDFSYWCGGPGTYPSAKWFIVTLRAADGHLHEVRLTNGQYEAGSGGSIAVKPGESIPFPAALAALSPGNYHVEKLVGEPRGYFPHGQQMVVTWPAMEAHPRRTLHVIQDVERTADLETDLLRRVREGDAFAQHVAMHYRINSVVQAMLRDLEADDTAVMQRAAMVLYGLKDYPATLGPAIRRAMAKHLATREPQWDDLASLAALAESEGSEASLDAVLALVAKPDALQQHPTLPQELFNFRQPRAKEALRQLLAHANPQVRFRAAVGLSRRHPDPAAIPVLLAASADSKHPERTHALSLLAEYPDDVTAVAAMNEAIADADPRVAEAARDALRDIERHRAGRASPAASTTAATQPSR